MALMLTLAIFASFAGSIYSNILYANQYGNVSLPFSYSVIGENTSTYDFSNGAGANKWAYRRQASQRPPSGNNVPSIEFSTAQYNRISSDDGIRQNEVANVGYYASHRFVFSIKESNITLIHILWNGIGRNDWIFGGNGATLYVWNYTSGNYEIMDTTTLATEVNLEVNISSGIENYIGNDKNLTILVMQNLQSFRFFFNFYSRLQTDYVKVDVNYIGG